MKVITSSSVENVDTSKEKCRVTIKTPKGEEIVEADIVLSAVGITTNLEDIGLEKAGVKRIRVKWLWMTITVHRSPAFSL